MSARVLLAHGPDAGEAASRLAAQLAEAGIAAVVLASEPAAAREALDACECVVLVYDRRGRDTAWLDQALGVALARRIPFFAVAREPRGFASEVIARPRSQRAFRELAARVREALPATPRAAVRSLAQSSDARWSELVAAEVQAELAARGWARCALPDAREQRARVFVDAPGGDAWCKDVGDARVWLRPRVAPFNPVDLLHVRGASASRVYEWWLLRDGRSDAWMKRVYRGEAEKLTPRTRFFGQRAIADGDAPRLVDRRVLTQRIDATGLLAAELAALEAWLSLQHVPRVGEQHVGAAEVDVPLHAG